MTFRPAITLDAAPTAEPRAPIALGGKVCCLADASTGPINIGDLLVSPKLIHLAVVAAEKPWTRSPRGWSRALNQLALHFEGRLPL